MEIKQLIIGLIQYDQSDVVIDGNKYFSQSDVVISFESVEDVIQKCEEKLNNEYDEYKIKITHEIFDHEINLDNLSYEDFVYKYGPSTHYFSSKSDSYCDNLSNKNSNITYLDNLGGELVYPEDFRKTKNKFNLGDICKFKRYKDDHWRYGIIYRVPTSIYDEFGKEKISFQSGYYIEEIHDKGRCDYQNILESNIELLNEIPEKYKEWLEIFSKIIKYDIELNIDEYFMSIKKITKKYKNGDIIIEDYDRDGKRISPEIIPSDNIETNLRDLKDSDQFKEIKKYDENGNLIYSKSSEYEEDFYFYINDILVQKRNHDIVNDTYSIILYDKNGNQIYKKNHEKKDCCIDLYDCNGNNIFNQSFGNTEWSIYDENNRIKQFIYLDNENDEVFVELYDYSGLNSHSIGYSTNGTKFESWTEYDKNGNKIQYKDTCDEYESIWKYDEDNRIIFRRDEFGNEYFYEYYEKEVNT